MLLRAYAMGIFPMADDRDDDGIFWVEPERRAILPLDGFRLSRSLRKAIARNRFFVTADRALARVVSLCADAAPDRPTTWISREIESSYAALHAAGHAHSIECWSRDPDHGDEADLLGGLYGVSLGRAFFGESMVSRAPDASKVALAHLVARLKAGGFTLLDCQFMTPHLASLGAVEIARDEYRNRLYCALSGASSPPAGAALPPSSPFAEADFAALDAVAGAGAGTPGKLIAQLLT
ncbi:MAG: leucyl/phenylalanyl-tRNA--protein transferase [Sphingomonadales bacterium]|nr:leucyl/phenylalanyl-tRNA--protein transferase [Sphingomonadales bacterium]